MYAIEVELLKEIILELRALQALIVILTGVVMIGTLFIVWRGRKE